MATVYRSSITGKFVTKAYADAHPDTTQAETASRAVAIVARVRAALAGR